MIGLRMTPRIIIDLQLEALFGTRLPLKIQRVVDHEMNLGRWVDGYELAAFPDEMDEARSRELLAIVLGQYPELRIDDHTLRELVEKLLPQSVFWKVLWIVHENGSYALTDSLRVARFNGASLVWRSPRISLDGIEFVSLTESKLCGLAWLGSDSLALDSPFTMDFETGELLEGQAMDF